MKLLDIIGTADDFKVVVTALASALGLGKLWGFIQKRQEARDKEIEDARKEVRELLDDRIKALERENQSLRNGKKTV